MRPLEVCLQGLERLEYRGYDSAGVALTAPGMDRVAVRKKAGRLSNLVEDIEARPLPDATVAIGHTRWATNGVPNDVNAHPHASRDGKVAIIHNGIIENASQLRLDLQAEGYRFVSGTDTEVAAKLLGKIVDTVIAETGEPDLFEAMRRLGRMLEGAFTILAVDCRQPGIVVGARHDSPLVVGLGEGENFLGSDVAAFVAYTKTAMEIGQDQAVMIDAHGVAVTDFDGNDVPEPVVYEIDWDASAAEKGGWDSFMDKEIHEEPAAVQRTLIGRLDDEGRLNLDEVHIDEHDFKTVDKIIVIGCGTASYAGMVAKYAIEHWVRIPVEVELAHEFRYRDPILTPRTLVVAISQSGETMDTLMALRHAREQGSKVLAICNTQGASIPRESDAVLYTHAGPEVAVASTKAFVAQITAAMCSASTWPSSRAPCSVTRSRRRSIRSRTCHARSSGCSTHSRPRCPPRPASCVTRTRSCSWAGTWATRSRSKAPSSSRRSPTRSRRASPPASSSTGRSRLWTKASRLCSSCHRHAAATCCTPR